MSTKTIEDFSHSLMLVLHREFFVTYASKTQGKTDSEQLTNHFVFLFDNILWILMVSILSFAFEKELLFGNFSYQNERHGVKIRIISNVNFQFCMDNHMVTDS